MTAFLLALVLTGGSFQGAPAQAPVFRAEVDLIPIDFSVSRSFFGIRRPYRGLTASDVKIVIDEKVHDIAKLTETKPGHYLGEFAPPEEYRDGKPHEVAVKIKNFPNFTRTITFPKPAPPVAP